MADNDLPIKGLPDAGTIDPVNDMLPIEQAATGKVSPAALIALALQQTLTSFSVGANLPVNSADSIFSGFQKLQGQLNNKTTFQRITLAAINTAISASGLTYPGFYEIYDAVSATKRVVVFASSVSAVSSLAFNLTDNTFGSYNISTDAFTALAQPNSILNGTGAPSGSTGNNGDFYMDTAGIFLFGPKTSGAWGAGISLVPLEDIVVDTTFTASPYTPMSGRDQWIRVDTTDGNCTLNVSSSSVDGETYYISNAAGTHNVVFNTSLTIAPGNSALVKYDASTTTWLVLFTTGAAWGTLSGTLSSQTDLQSALDAKQNLLGFTAENVANKDTDGTLTANSDTRYPSQKAVKTYVDASVVGLLDDRGNFDASGNAFPSSGGSGASGAIRKGDLWYISVAGTLGSVPVMVGDSIRALTDAPGSTSANWDILNVGIGYVPENVANKDTDGTLSSNSDTKYASQKATKTYVDTGLSGKLSTSATTDAVTEGTTNKYFTTARVLATALTGYAAAGSRTAIAATDTVLQAFGKVGKYLGDLAAVAFSGSYSDLTGTPTALPPNGSAGGDLTGSYPNPTIKSNVALGGNPTTTTQTSGDNSTKIATTAFVHTAVAGATPSLTSTQIGYGDGSNLLTGDAQFKRTSQGLYVGNGGTFPDIFINGGNATTVSADNIGIGSSSLANISGNSPFLGYENVAIGSSAMSESVNVAQSVAIGYQSGFTTGDSRGLVLIGTYSDTGTGAFTDSIAIGRSTTVGHNGSIALGAWTSTTADNQLVIGSTMAPISHIVAQAGSSTGQYLINVGYDGTNYPTWVGYEAGNAGASGIGTVFIGNNAGSNAMGANNSIFIGNSAGLNDTVQNQQFTLSYSGSSYQFSTDTQVSGSISGAMADVISDGGAGNLFVKNITSGGFVSGDILTGNISSSTASWLSTTLFETSYSILIGDNTYTGGFSNSIAIGYGATNTQSNEFLVATSYNIWNIAGIPYVMPSSSVAGALTNDGAGNLSWAAGGGGGTVVMTFSSFTNFTIPDTQNYDITFQTSTGNTVSAPASPIEGQTIKLTSAGGDCYFDNSTWGLPQPPILSYYSYGAPQLQSMTLRYTNGQWVIISDYFTAIRIQSTGSSSLTQTYNGEGGGNEYSGTFQAYTFSGGFTIQAPSSACTIVLSYTDENGNTQNITLMATDNTGNPVSSGQMTATGHYGIMPYSFMAYPSSSINVTVNSSGAEQFLLHGKLKLDRGY